MHETKHADLNKREEEESTASNNSVVVWIIKKGYLNENMLSAGSCYWLGHFGINIYVCSLPLI